MTEHDPPWVSEDSPMDEGSGQTAVPEGRRGERRAAQPEPGTGPDLGPTEPTPVPGAGPGGAPDPAPKRTAFHDRVSEDTRKSPDDLDAET